MLNAIVQKHGTQNLVYSRLETMISEAKLQQHDSYVRTRMLYFQLTFTHAKTFDNFQDIYGGYQLSIILSLSEEILDNMYN